MADIGRRSFLTLLPASAVGAFGLRASDLAGPRIVHPEPRAEIDASEVMTADQLSAFPQQVVDIYDMIREIPHIADGIGCSCGCSVMPHYRSLLTCFYPTGMAMGCPICQGQARLAYRRVQEGQSLEQIRRATDARYG